jgi:hypothetical protein
MKSKRFLKSSVKAGLKLLPLILFLSACNSSVSPSFLKEDISNAVKDICKKEYKLDVATKVVGITLWVYLPLENIISKPDKPEKYTEKFLLEDQKNFLDEKILKVSYLIKPIPEKEKLQEMVLDKSVNEKIFNVLQVIRRVLFSMDNFEKDKPLFFCIVTADIVNGLEIKQIFYLRDLKKLSYGLMSQTEYQHRIVQNTALAPLAIDDKNGAYLGYRDITMEEFIADQIQNRIRLKFQKPEVEKDADIDKEILKIIAYTLKAYEYNNYNFVEISNLVSGTKNIFNQKAMLTNYQE